MQTFRKKNNPFSAPVVINDKNDKFLTLSNGDTILITAFRDIYEEVISPVNENTNFNPSTETEVDASAFFKSTKINLITDDKKPNNQQGAPVTRIDNTQGINNQMINDNSVTRIVDDSPITRIDGTHSQQNEQTQPVTRIDNTNDIDNLFEDEIQLYGILEATKRKGLREKGKINQPNSGSVGINNQQSIHQNTSYVQPQQQMNPSEMMFKTFKRNHNISIKLEFKDKIGNPDFVRMMLENIDGDIVQYYKNLIMDNIMKNVADIENEVEEQIKLEIFGNKKAKKSKQTVNKAIIEDDDDKKNISITEIGLDLITKNNTETISDKLDDFKNDLTVKTVKTETFIPNVIEPSTNTEDIEQIVKDNTKKTKVVKEKSVKATKNTKK